MSGGISQIVSSMSIHNDLLHKHPWHLGLLYKPYAIDMRGEEREGDPPVYYRPIYSYYDGLLSCAVNFTYIRTAQTKTSVQLSPVENEALGLMEAIANASCFQMEFEPGDIQFLNNHVILHDRTPYEDDEPPTYGRPVFTVHDGRVTCSYTRAFIEAAQRKGTAPPLTGDQVRALDCFDAIVHEPEMHLEMELERGDMQFVNNRALFHARKDLVDHDDPAQKRLMLRLWLKTESGVSEPSFF